MAWDTGRDIGGVAYGIAAASQLRVRVIAGPGTGKSFAKRRVAAPRVWYRSQGGVGRHLHTRRRGDLHSELQKLGTPGCEELEGQTLHSLAMRILSRKHVLEAVDRSPRPLNTFKTKAMICDLTGVTVGNARSRR